jgi:cathepsin L
LAFVEKHNTEAAAGAHTFTVGINEYADLTVEEFKVLFNGFNATKTLQASMSQNIFRSNEDELPAAVDWRPKVLISITVSIKTLSKVHWELPDTSEYQIFRF